MTHNESGEYCKKKEMQGRWKWTGEEELRGGESGRGWGDEGWLATEVGKKGLARK